MSFFNAKSKEKEKDKDPFSKKSQFYVEFLGWAECRGVRGQKYTDPFIRELRRRQKKKMDKPPKLTIQVSRKDVKISQDVEEKKKRNIKKITFPSIPARDVTFVHQATRPHDGRPDDMVACIYLGYMPRTQRYVHTHVYRFDEASTASAFARQMAALVENNVEHIREVELELASRGEIDDPRLTSSDGMSERHTADSAVGSASSAYSDESPTFGSDDIDPDIQSLHEVQAFDSVADELKFRLQMGDSPLLLPPKDYDTISRAHGNLDQINKRRCLNLNIVGDHAIKDARQRNGSDESGVNMASPGSDTVVETESRLEVPPKLVVQKSASYGFSPSGSPQVPRKPQQESRGSPKTPHKPAHDNNINRYSSDGDLVYPPMQRNVVPFRDPHPIIRQGSQHSNHSHHSEGAKSSQHSDPETREENHARYYKSGDSGDIYALPRKGPGFSPRAMSGSPTDELPPPDYLDDDDDDDTTVRLLDVGPKYRQPNLTRSMPADVIRSEMALGSSSRPTSGDSRNVRRADVPVFVGGHNLHGSGNIHMHSPRMQQVNSAKR